MSCFSKQLEICNIYSNCNDVADITMPFILPLGQYNITYLEGIVYHNIQANSDGIHQFSFQISTNYDQFITFKIFDNFNNLITQNDYSEFYFIAKKQVLIEQNGFVQLT